MSNALPYTGFASGPLALIGLAFTVAGFVLRKIAV